MGIRDWFRREKKESATGRVVSYQKVGQPQWTPRNYEQFAREGYANNIVAYRCIDVVSKTAAAVPWVLYNPKDEEIDEHPVLKLLQRPNPVQGGASLMRNLYGFYFISGNGYLEGVGPDGRPPLELYTLRPDRMKVVPGRTALPEAFIYTVGSQEKRFEMDPLTGEGPILHLKNFHPLNDWYGLSPMEPAGYSIDQHTEASNWNKALLQNSGRPSGALSVSSKDGPAVLTDDQFVRLKGEIEEKYSGSRNAGRPMLLEGGLEWTEMAWNAKDMDWLNGKNLSAGEICQAFGVPPQMVGLEGSLTFANYEQARLALYEDAVLPFLNFVAEDLTNWLAPKFGGDIRLGYDEDQIPALAPRREKIFAMVGNASFMTQNEKRSAVGLEPKPGGDELMVDASQLPMGFDPEAIGPHAKEPKDPKEAQKLAYGD